jgi:ribosomal protein L11 methyltransferase
MMTMTYPRIQNDLWLVRTVLREAAPETLIDICHLVFEEEAVGLVVTPYKEGEAQYFEVLLGEEPTPERIKQCLVMIAEALEKPALFGESMIEKLLEKDWLLHVHEQFPAFQVGGFYIYGSHEKNAAPKDLIGLEINAATAFGSGEHPTTFGCLEALWQLHKEGRDFKAVLDMGSGSAILAIAAKKLWPSARVLAVDIDAEAVRVGAHHAALNGVEIISAVGDGYAADEVFKMAPYDLICANILAGPLQAMAHKAAEVSESGAILILAGLLKRQMDDVVRAHDAHGFQHESHRIKDDWPTVVMMKK